MARREKRTPKKSIEEIREEIRVSILSEYERDALLYGSDVSRVWDAIRDRPASFGPSMVYEVLHEYKALKKEEGNNEDH